MANVCNCPHPPGGQIECEPHQLAICRVSGGVVKMWCMDPPTNPQSQEELWNWALERITGIHRTPNQPVTGQDLAILNSGRYEDASRRLEVTFVLPRETDTATA